MHIPLNPGTSGDNSVPGAAGLDDADFVRLVRAQGFVSDLARTAADCSFSFDTKANALVVTMP